MLNNDDLQKIGQLMDQKLKQELFYSEERTSKKLNDAIDASEERMSKKLKDTIFVSEEQFSKKLDERITASERKIIKEVGDFIEKNLLTQLDEKTDKHETSNLTNRVDHLANDVGSHKIRLQKLEDSSGIAIPSV